MSEFEQNEDDLTFEDNPRAIRRRQRAQRRAERRAARGKKSTIAWPVVLMAGGASAVVSSLVVSIGVVSTAAHDSAVDPKAMSMLVQQVAGQSAGNAHNPVNRGASHNRDRGSADRGRSTSSNRQSSRSETRQRGTVRQAAARPVNRPDRASGRSSARPSRPAPSRPAPSGSGGRPPAPPVNSPGGNGPGGNGPGGIDNIPVVGDIIALIKGLIDLIQNGIADRGQPPGGNGGDNGGKPGPFGSSGRGAQPTHTELAAVLEDGEEGIPAFTRVVSCLNQLGTPIEDPTVNNGGLPLLNPSNLTETAAGGDILRIIIAEITTEGKLSSQTLTELDERSAALCQ